MATPNIAEAWVLLPVRVTVSFYENVVFIRWVSRGVRGTGIKGFQDSESPLFSGKRRASG